ncbi:two-component system chemotaxis response regulator CheB [Variovorax boronicumulans]|uniref:protein-glutamate methylesterase n=1 Tax=Variovorax boronicumulans TaxID=436515 RepID=A0AAW8D6B3_9BURK|nr:chemotaxis protein CheB [Variovorax boronicumulans]MDP9895638.1 two-component system chemotaxis response regulator CheB [Variovorax boronicumulans]MDQ0055654.1 two-component system chemotaxis response regulator CheB [Variovorax boronicumulans]
MTTTLPRPYTRKRVDMVVLGASAGGIDALMVLLHDLPAGWRLPMTVVLHLPENHDSHLAEIFAQRLAIPVHEAADKMPIAVGTLYFAPPGYHLSIERERCFSLSCEAPVLFSRPSIDVLMASAADAYGPALAGFLLTGANDDGAEGLYRIHLAGGLTAVQDPKEALISIMPNAALARHTPDHVLPLRELRALLLQLEAAHAH